MIRGNQLAHSARIGAAFVRFIGDVGPLCGILVGDSSSRKAMLLPVRRFTLAILQTTVRESPDGTLRWCGH